jgi:hypothetical protein
MIGTQKAKSLLSGKMNKDLVYCLHEGKAAIPRHEGYVCNCETCKNDPLGIHAPSGFNKQLDKLVEDTDKKTRESIASWIEETSNIWGDGIEQILHDLAYQIRNRDDAVYHKGVENG